MIGPIILIKTKGWVLYEEIKNYKEAYLMTSKFLYLHSPYRAPAPWELAQTVQGKIYLNKRAIDQVMIFQECPQVIKDTIMMYMI